MTREFTFNILLLFLINFLVKPLYIFGIDAEVQNRIGTEAFGWYFHCFNIVFLLSVVNDPGIQNWNTQFLSTHKSGAVEHLRLLAGTKIILSALMLLVVWSFAWISGYGSYIMFTWISLTVILSSVFMVTRTSLSGLGHYRADSWLSGLDKILMLLLLGFFLYVQTPEGGFTLTHFVVSQMAASALACGIALAVLFARTQWIVPRFSLRKVADIVRRSGPFLLILLFMTAYTKLDGILLGFLIDDNHHAVGVYAAAWRLYDAASMTGYLFASVLLPMYAAHLRDKKVLSDLLSAGLRYSLVVAGGALITVLFFGHMLLSLLYEQVEPAMHYVLIWLIFAYLCNAVAYIFGTLVVASGQVRQLNVVYGTGLAVNIILHLSLIPVYGVTGAAVTTFLTQLLVLTGQIVLVHRQFAISADVQIVQRGVIYLSIAAAGTYAIDRLTPWSWWVVWLLSVIICVLLSFLVRLVEWKDFAWILSSRSGAAGNSKTIEYE